MRYFPLFLDLRDRRAVVVGGGEEALRKVRLLLKTEASDRRSLPPAHPELDGAGQPWPRRLARHDASQPCMLDGAALVYRRRRPALEEAVSAAAQTRGIPVNVVDRADLSTFITPADRRPRSGGVAIGTEGAAPVFGQGIRAARSRPCCRPRLGALARRGRPACGPRVAASFAPGVAAPRLLAAVSSSDRCATVFSAGDNRPTPASLSRRTRRQPSPAGRARRRWSAPAPAIPSS